ncbi:MAG: hypothetical protein QOF48_3170 [Verrucomicrobiota bacterium]|jgi:hypothetical protein
MSERRKQADFLKALLASDDRPEHRHLGERLLLAERDERCMQRACRLVAVVTFLAIALLGYLMVLKVPNDMTHLAQTAFRFCQALALGSAMCLGVFIGLLFWHRALINRIFADGRKLITAAIQQPADPTRTTFPTVVVHEGDTAVYHIRTPQSAHGAEIISMPKAL